jgi:hypothetical protein
MIKTLSLFTFYLLPQNEGYHHSKRKATQEDPQGAFGKAG